MSDNKENLIPSEEKKTMRLSRITRIIIFSCFFVIHLLNCSDGGVVSARSNQIKEELNINDKSFGLYGSIVQIGRIIGTLSEEIFNILCSYIEMCYFLNIFRNY